MKATSYSHHKNEAVDLIPGGGLRRIFFRNRSNMARIATKLRQNAFQTISDVSFFDTEKKNSAKISFLADLVWILKSHGRTDLKINFLVYFCSR